MTPDEELRHLRQHVTNLQAYNSAVLERARVAEYAAADAQELSRVAVECAERMCADYRAEIDAAHDIIDAPDSEVERLEAEVEAMARQMHETLYELASVTMSRDALASASALSVPPALARLYRAAQGARAKWSGATQHSKLAEECGEYVAAWSKEPERYSRDRTMAEAHDVLTVALSLCEPAMMAASAERLERRLT